jgi:hypothetical protein
VHYIMGNVEGYHQVFLNNCKFPRKCDMYLLNFSGLWFHASDVYVAFLKTYYFINYSCHILSTTYCSALDSLFYVKAPKLTQSPFMNINTAFLFMGIGKEGTSGNI